MEGLYRVLEGAMVHERDPMQEQSVTKGLYSTERIHSGAVLEELQPVGRAHDGEVCEGLYPMGETPHR